jgi:hypothetical protein
VPLITARDTSESLSSHLPRTPEASQALEARQIPDLISIIGKLDDVVLPLLTSVQPAIGLNNRALETRRISDRSGIFGDLLSGSGNGGVHVVNDLTSLILGTRGLKKRDSTLDTRQLSAEEILQILSALGPVLTPIITASDISQSFPGPLARSPEVDAAVKTRKLIDENIYLIISSLDPLMAPEKRQIPDLSGILGSLLGGGGNSSLPIIGGLLSGLLGVTKRDKSLETRQLSPEEILEILSRLGPVLTPIISVHNGDAIPEKRQVPDLTGLLVGLLVAEAVVAPPLSVTF